MFTFLVDAHSSRKRIMLRILKEDIDTSELTLETEHNPEYQKIEEEFDTISLLRRGNYFYPVKGGAKTSPPRQSRLFYLQQYRLQNSTKILLQEKAAVSRSHIDSRRSLLEGIHPTQIFKQQFVIMPVS